MSTLAGEKPTADDAAGGHAKTSQQTQIKRKHERCSSIKICARNAREEERGSVSLTDSASLPRVSERSDAGHSV